MPFTYPADQTRLWTILGITRRTELLQNSQSGLYRLMTDTEKFDTKNGTILVNTILGKMQDLDAINAKILEFMASPNPRMTKSEDSYLEGSETYEGKGLLAIYKQQKDELIQQIRDLIDPCGCFVIQHGYADVIAT
jgi:acyl carrier protein phosphodiesterase